VVESPDHGQGGVVESYKKFDYRKLSFDATRMLFMTCTLELPWRRQFSGLERAVGKGWSVSTLMHYHKGSPGTATDSVAVGGDPDLGTASGGGRILFPANQSNSAGHAPTGMRQVGSTAQHLHPNRRWARAMPFNNVIAPASYQGDLSLRIFDLPGRERYGPVIQVDAYDASNQTNWSALDGFR
jgi:hypothetical protein